MDSLGIGTNALAKQQVPNIFIKGVSIGGCDDLTKLHSQGKLETKLKEAGAL